MEASTIQKLLFSSIINIILLVCFIIVGITGLLIFPGLLSFFNINLNILPKIQFFLFHHWTALLLILTGLVHVGLHLKWYKTKIQKFRTKAIQYISYKKNIQIITNFGLLLSFPLVLFTGLLKFPGLLPSFGISPISIPFNEISVIHDWSGIFTIFFSLIHILLHIKWFQQIKV